MVEAHEFVHWPRRLGLSKGRIRLASVGPLFTGRAWTSSRRLRVGRVGSLEVVLDHRSISRFHAEVAPGPSGWGVRDLGSTNGTLLNGVRIGQAPRTLQAEDVLQFGEVALAVAFPQARRADTPATGTPAVLPGGGELFVQTVTALAQAVELRDKYTGGHTQRVTNYALLLADRLALSASDKHLLQIGTPLHDIGKIGVDDAVLRKQGPLTHDEFANMQSHTVRGALILAGIPGLLPVLPIVRSHHERWDGKGYPDRLAAEAIPLLARVVTVADAFDAMTSDRPYRKGLPLEKAFAEVETKAGIQFDPRCARAFLDLRADLEELIRQRQELLQTCEHQFTLADSQQADPRRTLA
jgi:HD-GYP domain-containing protein (c-di-GMP phosphodiesterase class II)